MRGGTREDPIHYHSPRKASPPGCEMEDLVQGALLCSAFLAQDLLQFKHVLGIYLTRDLSHPTER